MMNASWPLQVALGRACIMPMRSMFEENQLTSGNAMNIDKSTFTLESMRKTHAVMTWTEAEATNCSNLPVFEIERESFPDAKLHVYCTDYLILELEPGRFEVSLYDRPLNGTLEELEEQLYDFIKKEGF